MAINKKLIHFNTFENFNSKKLSANVENTKYTLGISGEIQTGSPDILYLSIVYIKDTKQQWTHGLLYISDDNYFETKENSISKLQEAKDYTDIKTDELRDVVTQTLSLRAGYKWCSFYVDITLEQLQRAFGTNVTSIITSFDGITEVTSSYDANTNTWSGDLTVLDVTKMYVINANTACEISLTGRKIPNSISYTLNPGWNWISYPFNEPMDISDALANVEAAEGDAIKDKSGDLYTEYYQEYGWLVLSTTPGFIPGQGYKYYNASTEPNTLVFTTELIDIKSELNKKQDAITDLETIRQGAAKGATALQSYVEQYKGTVTGVKINGTTKNPSNGIVDLGTVITSHQDISSKQDTLVSGSNIKTINGTSILGSGDIVISGGGSSSGSGAYALVEHGTNDTTYTLTSNTFHVWGEVGSLTLTFGEEQSGVANEFLFQFESGNEATTLALPDDIIWDNDDTPVIESNYTYQVSILKGFATLMKFKKKTNLIENKLTITNSGMSSTFTFEYPVASDVSVVFTSDFGDTDMVTIYGGSLSGKTEMAPGYESLTNNNVDYITPEMDSIYIYTF